MLNASPVLQNDVGPGHLGNASTQLTVWISSGGGKKGIFCSWQESVGGLRFFYYWYLRYLIFKILIPKAKKESEIYTKYSNSVLQVLYCRSQLGSRAWKLLQAFLLGISCQLGSPKHCAVAQWALWRGSREVLVTTTTLFPPLASAEWAAQGVSSWMWTCLELPWYLREPPLPTSLWLFGCSGLVLRMCYS